MGAAALEPGKPDGGATPRTLKRPATHTPETHEAEIEAEVAGWSPARVDRESAEEGPCDGGPEVHVAEVVPQNYGRRKKLAFQKEPELGVLNAGTMLGHAAHVE